MGVIGRLFDLLFGGGRNGVVETIEVFRENAEKEALRAQDRQAAALAQFAQEFRDTHRSGFDRLMDGINRLPRPLMALGCIALFVAAMVNPLWFAARMQGMALVPEPLWWLLGVVVSFYFGARHQSKHQQFQKDIAQHLTQSKEVIAQIEDIEKQGFQSRRPRDVVNPALAEWRNTRG